MSRPLVSIVDVLTGERIEREMNDAEYAEHIDVLAQHEAARVEAEQREQQQAAAKASARAKLKALGLTDDEIAALIP